MYATVAVISLDSLAKIPFFASRVVSLRAVAFNSVTILRVSCAPTGEFAGYIGKRGQSRK